MLKNIKNCAELVGQWVRLGNAVEEHLSAKHGEEKSKVGTNNMKTDVSKAIFILTKVGFFKTELLALTRADIKTVGIVMWAVNCW